MVCTWPADTSDDLANVSNPNLSLLQNALYQLQLLFSFLDRGIRDIYNPLALVNSLKLDISMQQDAQEYESLDDANIMTLNSDSLVRMLTLYLQTYRFCNLFMARIDSQLQRQKGEKLQNFIKNRVRLLERRFFAIVIRLGNPRYSSSLA